MNTLRLALLALALVLLPSGAYAQLRSYHFDAIEAEYVINADSTVDVLERQTYEYVGTYNQGWRSVAHDKISAITDVSVVDQDGTLFVYSGKRLDKLDRDSWGKYTVFKENGATHIEWYYNLADTTHTFELRYTVHGAVGFYKDYDELYWNVFTDYDVPVDEVTALVRVPEAVTTPRATIYITGDKVGQWRMQDDTTYLFWSNDIAAGEDVTIAASWQKGLVDKSAYWLDMLKMYWEVVAGIAVFAGFVVFAIGYRVHLARLYRGRGTIIPQFEPPQNLPPAMAEVIAKSHITHRAWPATIVDLAVKGYLSIEEKVDTTLYIFKSRHYVLHKLDNADDSLEEYEREYLNALFADGPEFSTKELEGSSTKKYALTSALSKITRHLYKETETDTQAFAIGPGMTTGKSSGYLLPGLCIAGVVLLAATMHFILAAASAIGLVVVWYAMKVMPALNTAGKILKEEWLGFKMFLEVTGRDRMQNLTPETFERYLPYAMIFGVEKQWAKKFETMHVPPPQWYTGPAVYASGTDSAATFSPNSFASSFSASFASTFTSSSGGGASGGGGSAGGGGGGGGGGAS